MTSKADIEACLKGVVSDRFIELWWDLKIPGLGMRKPKDVFETEPLVLLSYAQSYKENFFA